MLFTDYPNAIARIQRQILDTDQHLIGLTEGVKIFEAEIDKAIAFDTSLKNEAQRKARRIELQQTDGNSYAASRLLRETKEKREILAIELELLRNQFAILKLEKREAIARLEVELA
ncbi:hypothetical protein [Chroococcidiopsis sp. TS-821]|uniref:hypothetical protein n=1 Tax=Chroococcidiopsis sp. TS-821 TaxID=1378066 RepID=UPI000CEDA9BC|nr:hypothetical protein [Chroococcidiopsis sp. TS-821]PPS41931.1 hypothetical protein B1A85_15740 [Chroococcidiopsis sp. TS-821]